MPPPVARVAPITLASNESTSEQDDVPRPDIEVIGEVGIGACVTNALSEYDGAELYER